MFSAVSDLIAQKTAVPVVTARPKQPRRTIQKPLDIASAAARPVPVIAPRPKPVPIEAPPIPVEVVQVKVVPVVEPDPPRIGHEFGDYTMKWTTEKRTVILLLRFSAWLLRGYCKVADRDSDEIIPLIKPRHGQVELIRKSIAQALSGQPVRGNIPKYRRHGISTIITAFNYFICWTEMRRKMMTVAHKDDAATYIFAIAKIIHEFHPAQSGAKRDPEQEIYFPQTRSKYVCRSGLGTFTGSGDTLHGVHVSEFAKFSNTSDQDKRAMRSMLNAVSQKRLDTFVFIESSGQGPDGDFPVRCRSAEKGDGNYWLLFIPWLLDPSLMEDMDEVPESFDPPIGGYELLLKRMNATDAQLLWRRKHLRDNFGTVSFYENPPAFAWDFPVTLEDCFAQKAGRVYPMFSKYKHVRRVDKSLTFLKTLELRRCIDWGWGKAQPKFVCLWLAIDRSKPPQVIVDESCEHFIAQHLNYARDPKTGKPIKSNDDCCDSFRYGIITFRVTCLVYVYRELVAHADDTDGALSMGRKIHSMSGWVNPDGSDSPHIAKFIPGGKGERYQTGVADKSLGLMIRTFNAWGIPLQPYTKPDDKDDSKGIVEDGIRSVEMLFSADGLIRPEGEDARQELYQRALTKLGEGDGLGRKMCLTAEELKELDRRHPRIDQNRGAGRIDGPGRNMLQIARMLRR